MRLRNKARTKYNGVAPGGTLELPDHEAQKLLEQLPWHFEKVEEKKPKSPEVVPPAPPVYDPPPRRKRRED